MEYKPLKFLPICEGNRIAAVILDYVYTFYLVFDRVQKDEPFRETVESGSPPYFDYYFNPEPFGTILHYDEVNWEGYLEYGSIALFRSRLVLTSSEAKDFTSEQIVEAIDFLDKKKRFIHLGSYMGEWREDELFTIYCTSYSCEMVDAALSRLREVVHVEPLPLSPFDMARERRIVAAQNARSGRIGQFAVLTLEEWIETLTHFHGRCAFNSGHPYQVLEHFYPLSSSSNGAGTSVFNCIPACVRCNVVKSDRLPVDIVSGVLKDAIPAIQTYLEERKERWLHNKREN